MTLQLNKFIGDKAFYRRALAIAVPIMVQNGITNFVSLLDNIMVGRIGTEQMSGVAIANQLIMIYFLCIFGGVAGAGIFTAQYYGEGNDEGGRNTIRFKIWMGIALTAFAIIVFTFFGEPLISLYLHGTADGGDISAALGYGRQYLGIIMIGFVPYMMLQVYTSTLRECNETVLPMKAGIVAVIVNLALNYVLIYGKLGFPALGVRGAAIATVCARYTEALVVIIWTHRHKEHNSYIIGLYKTLKIKYTDLKRLFIKGLPLLCNETLWSASMAVLTQCYSVRGLNAVAGVNIANTVFNVFSIVFIALGDAVAIIVGQLLGAGKMEEAKDTDTKLIVFSVLSCTVIALLLAVSAPIFPELYNTTPQARQIATHFMLAQAVFMPQMAFTHATYFTLRSGGKTFVTFIFDSAYMWVICVPVAFVLSRYTGLSALWIYIAVQVSEWFKCILGFVLVKKGVWMQNITK